jgi:hypothetical protein
MATKRRNAMLRELNDEEMMMVSGGNDDCTPTPTGVACTRHERLTARQINDIIDRAYSNGRAVMGAVTEWGNNSVGLTAAGGYLGARSGAVAGGAVTANPAGVVAGGAAGAAIGATLIAEITGALAGALTVIASINQELGEFILEER